MNTSQPELPSVHYTIYGVMYSVEFSVGSVLNAIVLAYFLSKKKPSNSR